MRKPIYKGPFSFFASVDECISSITSGAALDRRPLRNSFRRFWRSIVPKIVQNSSIFEQDVCLAMSPQILFDRLAFLSEQVTEGSAKVLNHKEKFLQFNRIQQYLEMPYAASAAIGNNNSCNIARYLSSSIWSQARRIWGSRKAK